MRLKTIDEVLTRAERTIALLDRCRALNAASERRRLLAAWQAGRRIAPSFCWAPAPELGALRSALAAVVEEGERAGAWGRLYAERAEELDREASAAEAIGSASFRAVAAARFARVTGHDGRCAERWVRAWSRTASSSPGDAAKLSARPSDDARDRRSLLSAMQRAVGELRLPVRVIVSDDLPSAAAAGDGVVLVRGGVRYSDRDVARIVLHELHGHVLPRQRAHNERLGLFGVASAGGTDEEEGHALLLERRAGYLDAHRRAELARRHVAACTVRDGAEWIETVDALQKLDTSFAEAIDFANRAHRGGGLGRELIYLPALSRVRRALAADPSLEAWLERGRLSIEAARTLRELGTPPESLRAA
jgi:hypothetical protein